MLPIHLVVYRHQFIHQHNNNNHNNHNNNDDDDAEEAKKNWKLTI